MGVIMTIEELQEQLLQEQQRNQELQANFDKLTTDNAKLADENKRLVDYNNKLFMRVTEQTKPESAKKELTAEEKESNLIASITEIMHKK